MIKQTSLMRAVQARKLGTVVVAAVAALAAEVVVAAD
jgi:hypothetical protein